MTNEEKAKEIGTTIWKEWKDSTLATGAERGAILMADWKDQQFIECLERLQERFVEYDKHSDWEAIQEIINKFKK